MIIAEIGQNWCADMALGKELIVLAKENGADLAKFQLYDSKELYGEYQNTELTKAQAFELFNYGKDIGIEVFFSVFDVERVKWCEGMGDKRYKIACKMRDEDVINAVVRAGKEIIISANHPHCIGDPKIKGAWLFCVSEYPAQLKYMPDFEEDPLFVGFSDHTLNLTASKVAISRGAKIIERHFAIDHKTGVDALWSMTPDELRELKRFETVCKEAL